MPSGRRVLIVEDNADIRTSLREALEDDGYVVYEAENGRIAHDLLAGGSVSPGLILLDLMMPVMNGWQFVAAVRGGADPSSDQIPIVVLSASSEKPPVGMAATFKKPFELEALLAAVQTHCR